MILSEIRDYVRARGQASLGDIMLHFDSDPDAVRSMLRIWISKGKISKAMLSTACGSSCSSCDAAITEIYRWNDC